MDTGQEQQLHWDTVIEQEKVKLVFRTGSSGTTIIRKGARVKLGPG